MVSSDWELDEDVGRAEKSQQKQRALALLSPHKAAGWVWRSWTDRLPCRAGPGGEAQAGRELIPNLTVPAPFVCVCVCLRVCVYGRCSVCLPNMNQVCNAKGWSWI